MFISKLCAEKCVHMESCGCCYIVVHTLLVLLKMYALFCLTVWMFVYFFPVCLLHSCLAALQLSICILCCVVTCSLYVYVNRFSFQTKQNISTITSYCKEYVIAYNNMQQIIYTKTNDMQHIVLLFYEQMHCTIIETLCQDAI